MRKKYGIPDLRNGGLCLHLILQQQQQKTQQHTVKEDAAHCIALCSYRPHLKWQGPLSLGQHLKSSSEHLKRNRKCQSFWMNNRRTKDVNSFLTNHPAVGDRMKISQSIANRKTYGFQSTPADSIVQLFRCAPSLHTSHYLHLADAARAASVSASSLQLTMPLLCKTI